jgi:GT2 family glycosyltransferase
MRVDLIWIDSVAAAPPDWGLGGIVAAEASPRAVAAAVARRDAGADAILFWDATLGAPDEAAVLAAARTPGDVWHAGLSLGMGGRPRMIDYVDPVWRFNRDPAPEIEATSWRLSLGACLARAAVLDRLGGPDPAFQTLAGASLELGHRWIRRGALMRHVAALLPDGPPDIPPPDIPLDDEIRFLRLRYGRVWTAWACWRRWRLGGAPAETLRAYRRPQAAGVAGPAAHLHEPVDAALIERYPTVSILIPTLDRYPHLFNLLDQLRRQTVRPLEIVVVDQTNRGERDPNWPERFADLPLRVLWRDEAGQCSSRNAGLAQARGETVLFLDDDDEVEPDLIARHLAFLARFDADASCGVAHEAGAGPLPPEFALIRDSDVFPTNNSLLRVAALHGSGLFDLAYEKGERADHDLGMRLYLSGAKLILNPSAAVLHLHAPRGGLRQHKARVVTRSSSRGSVWQRQFLAPTEAYLWARYFDTAQGREAALIRTVSTLRGRGSKARRLARAAAMLALLPDTWRQNKTRLAAGRAMLDNFPAIPTLGKAKVEELLTL